MTPGAVAAALSAAGPRSRWRLEVSRRPDGVVVVNDGGEPAEVDRVVAEAAVPVEVVHIAPGAGGRCIAANVGVRAAGTEFVVLHDDDDRWHPEFLARTVAWFKKLFGG